MCSKAKKKKDSVLHFPSHSPFFLPRARDNKGYEARREYKNRSKKRRRNTGEQAEINNINNNNKLLETFSKQRERDVA